MRIEKEGFVLHLEGTWCEISISTLFWKAET